MKSHFELNDTQFEQQFKSCKLDPTLFCHEAHLRLAYIHIGKYGQDQAITNVCDQLKGFVTHLGATDKYNTTLTIAAVKTVYHFMQKGKANDFKGFIAAFPQLKYEFQRMMQSHYDFDVFNSQKAKKTFLKPNLLPFD